MRAADGATPSTASRHWVVYRPRSLVLGIGCSSGVSVDEIAALVDATLAEAGLSSLSVAAVATLDRKAHEPGLVAFCAARALPLLTFSAAELDGVPGQEYPSDVVRAAVGTRGVCEPAALRAAGAAALLVPKRKSRMATVAVARRTASVTDAAGDECDAAMDTSGADQVSGGAILTPGARPD